MKPRRRPLGGLLLTLALPRLGRAQGFPDRPLRFIVPFAPGGSTDVTGRVLAEAVGSTLGQTVVVENRTGAGLVVGTEVAARAEPDGQTVLVTSNSHAIVPSLVAKLPYDPVTDFAGVFIPGALPQTVVINPKLPARTLGEFIALLKAEPGRYAYASGGIGSAIHLGSLNFLAAAGVEMLHVPYRGGGPAMMSVITGETAMMIDPVASSAPHIRAGTVRALALGAANRSAILPEVPTAAEAGLPAFRAEAWIALLVPARTPSERIARLNALCTEAAQQGAAKLAAIGLQPMPDVATPAQVTAFVRADIARLGPLLQAAGIRPE
jgi:tripartite-type tricarboxylate transporter receptor subunit TctC